ncbi:MAG: agmatine deiminase family protein [Bacteroidota bacterium]
MKNRILFISAFVLLIGTQLLAQNKRDYRKLHYLSEEEMLTPFKASRDFTPTDPPEGDIRNVAEFDQMQGVLVRYPFGIPIELIIEMADYTTVTTIVANSSQQQSVTTTYQSNNVNLNNCNFLITPSDSYWVRDYGPWFVFDGNNQPGIVDFPYNRPRPNDNNIPQKVSEFLNIDLYGMNLISTGGNYMCDGMGIAASTDLVWDENPSLTHPDIASYVNDYLNNSPYHVMEDPLGEYIKHIDCWSKFLSPGKVLVGQVPVADYRYQDFEDAANYFATQTSSYGKPYEVHRVFTPGTYPNTPYTNSLILNNKVFVPITGSQWDDEALATYEEIMPGYEIIGIIYNGWENTDALHCRAKGIADIGMLYIHHIPTTGTVSYNPTYEITADITANSGSDIYSDSVLVYYKINSGTYSSSIMELEGGNTFTGIIENVLPSDTVSYYIYAADESGRNASSPYIGEPDPFVFTNIYFPVTEISFNPDTVLFETTEEMFVGIPLNIINIAAHDITINSITEFGTEFMWFVEEMPNLPYTLIEDDTLVLNIMCEIPVSSYGYMIADELFVETNFDTYTEDILIDSDLISGLNSVTLSDKNIIVYPNPFTDKLNFIISDDLSGDALIQIFDINGNKIFDETEYITSDTENVITISTNNGEININTGTYFYRVTIGNHVETGKLIRLE